LQQQTELNLGVGSTQFGEIFSIMSLISVLSAPVSGFLMDQFGIILALYIACGLVSLG
jgi:hypothetical protein